MHVTLCVCVRVNVCECAQSRFKMETWFFFYITLPKSSHFANNNVELFGFN